MSTTKLDTLLAHYAASHRDHRNEIIHCICVPAIVFAVIGLIYALSFGLTLITFAAALFYYYRLGHRAVIEMAAMLTIMFLVWAFIMPLHHIVVEAVAIFAIAWVGQFVGHAFEGAKPSFTDDLQYLLIGPLFVLDVLKRKITGTPQPIAR